MQTQPDPTGRTWGPDDAGVVRLPSGALVRGRSLRAAVPAADFTLVLGDGPRPPWPVRAVRWPDFWVPLDLSDAVSGLREVLALAASCRVEVACRGGKGRTGTALAALAVLEGMPPGDAVRWVRRCYRPEAVEMPWQRWWLHRVVGR